MSSDGNNADGKDSVFREAIIKFPEPSSQLEKIRAALVARGVSPDQLQLLAIEDRDDGNKNVKISVNQEIFDAIVKAIGIKLFSPDNEFVKIGNVGARIDYIEDNQDAKNRWGTTEKRRRTPKLKGETERDPT